jgi:SCP-2 sterol transfer family
MPIQLADSEQAAGGPVGLFFAGLAETGHIATFDGQSATVRLDVVNGDEVERWHLTVSRGDVDVTRGDLPADAIMRIDRRQAEAMVTGRLNAQAAILRGALACEGKLAAVVMFQRCLPGPPDSTGRAAPISGETVMARIRAAQLTTAMATTGQGKPA